MFGRTRMQNCVDVDQKSRPAQYLRPTCEAASRAKRVAELASSRAFAHAPSALKARSRGRELNPRPTDYETGAVSKTPRCPTVRLLDVVTQVLNPSRISPQGLSLAAVA